MERIKRIVFVCTGNTDRSPMALAVACREAKVRNLCIELDSCGAFADSGHSAKLEAVRACAEAGLDISEHISKTIFDIEDSSDTLYVVMEKEHITRLQIVKSISDERIVLLGGGIPDPFDCNMGYYLTVFRLIRNAVHELFDELFGKMKKLLLFDLDDTLLRSDKTISDKTLSALKMCRESGYIIGVSTSRSESNSSFFLKELSPEIVISSGGAMVTLCGNTIALYELDGTEADRIIAMARELCGDINISADTADKEAEYYRNFDPPQDELWKSWGKSVYTDYRDFSKPVLKMCFEIIDEEKARQFIASLPGCDCIRFSDGEWYKITKAGVTKENAIQKVCDSICMSAENIIAFGDDLADIGMLKMCGTGVAMGNALPEIKAAADVTIGSNDDDGIADYLFSLLNES